MVSEGDVRLVAGVRMVGFKGRELNHLQHRRNGASGGKSAVYFISSILKRCGFEG